jgi:hypothetical protein
MDQSKENAEFPSCDAYFEAIQSKKKLPLSLQESLTAAFAQIPVSSFPEVPTGRGTHFCQTDLLNCFISHVFHLVYYTVYNPQCSSVQ